MQLPVNTFKRAMRQGEVLIGCWVGFASTNVAEAMAVSGFDWLVLDGEHAPNDPRSVIDQLRALAPYPVQPIVRPVEASVALVKQYLDIGAQTLLIPMVDTPEQAALMVSATRYAPTAFAEWALRWRVPRVGVRSQITSIQRTMRFACLCKPRRRWPCKTCRRSLRPMGLMVCFLVPLTYRPQWATEGNPTILPFAKPCLMVLPQCVPRARRRAFS